MTDDQLCTRCQELEFEQPYPVWDKDPKAGLCLFHSEREDKKEEFKKAIDKMIEAGNCNFRGFVFLPEFRFIAKTLKDPDFWQASFKGRAWFLRATFQGNTNFSLADFQGTANFGSASFLGYADFWDVRFQRGVVFRRALVRGGVLFEGTDYTSAFSGNEEIDLSDANFHRADNVTFRRVSLCKTRFFDTPLAKVNFIDVKWAKDGWRDVLYDELHPFSCEDYASLAEMYRQLKINYEEKRDWGQANHFHYGQMEMQRKDEERPSLERKLLWIYKYLAGYGVRYQNVFIWIVLCWLAFGAVYSLLPGVSGDGLLHSLRAMTLLDRGIPAQPGGPPMPPYFRWLTTLQSVIGPTLFALLILALRRRFRF